MNIAEMHVWFRQYAQQMGMQNVRAILPEQIDLLINTSITDIVNQLIKENIGITNDRIITDNSKIGQINALRSLYTVELIDLTKANGIFTFKAANRLSGRLTTNNNTNTTNNIPDYLFLVDFSINYKKTSTGYVDNISEDVSIAEDALETNYFPIRMIDDSFLADTLNDFILKNRLRSPIIVTYNNDSKSIFDLYIDKFKSKTIGNTTYYTLDNDLIPYTLRMSYIAKPAIVSYSEDINGTNVDCNLPEYMHVDILKHAVDLYRIAVSGSLYNSQQQSQQGETTRSN